MKFTKFTLFTFLLLALAQSSWLKAQGLVTGVVSDANGTLIGAAVVEKGSNNGVVTDLDGKYSIELRKKKAVLEISYVGYKTQEFVVGNRTIINVQLETDNALDEVVVVGYGTQKKSVTTGAISKIKSTDLENLPVQRVEQSLLGRTSGVTVPTNSGSPGGGATVRIRGTTSINNSDPLYVVDGVPIGGGIDFLNQNDIESIEVLKDAASAAIYGARSANGVILVTTKKGKKDVLEVSLNSYFGVQNASRKQSVLNAREYGILMNESSVASGGKILFPNPDALGTGTDWQNAVFGKNVPIQNNEVSISAGSGRSTYYASFGYTSQSGIVAPDQSNFQRYSLRFNSTHKLNDFITVGNTLGYSRNASKTIAENTEYGSSLGRAVNLDPITPVIETRPDVLNSSVFQSFKVVRDASGQPYGISPYVTSEILNPLAAVKVDQRFGWGDKVSGNFFLEFEPIKGLKYRSSLGIDFAYYGDESFLPIYYLNAATRQDITKYSRTQNRAVYTIWDNTLSFTKTIAEKHNFTLLAGTVAEQNRGTNISGTIQDIPATDISNASFNFPTTPDKQSVGGYEFQGALLSYLGRLNYNYAGKYLFSALFRVDGSPKFGANYRFGTFPSVSLGWVVSEEAFLKNNASINFLKFRGSWGVNGNDKIGDFRFVSTIQGGKSYTFGAPERLTNGAIPSALANPDLRWEQTTQTNFGFDAKIFKSISVTVDWYKKATTGMLLDIAVPGYVGNYGPVGNIASMNNTGIELELGYAKKIGDFKFEINGNISHIKNEVVDIGQDKKYLTGQYFSPQGLEITRTSVGQPISYFFGYKTNGIFQNQAEVNAYKATDGSLIQPNAKPGDFKFVDVNGDGKITADDRTKVGDPTPNLTYGFTLNAAYKGFDLIMFGQGVSGNQIFNATRRFDLQMANLSGEALNRWTGEGSSNTYPRLVMNDPNQNFSRSSDFYVQDGSFFRIKTLQLGYTLPFDISSRVGMKRCRIYISGNNLLTLTKYKGFDPEIGGGSYGVDRGIYPQARFFLVGGNISF